MPAPLILTPGEPGGIGSEITAKAWQALAGDAANCFCLITDATFLQQGAERAGCAVPVQLVASVAEANTCFKQALPILHRPLTREARLGSFSAATAQWVLAAIEEAADLCMAGAAAGMTTNPIQKEALYAAGFSFQGHTDFLGHLAKKRGHQAHDVMMLVAGNLRAVPVTVHIALKEVPRLLTKEAIVQQGLVVHAALSRYFAVAKPRIAFTGLNPHAGENGSMGREEIEIIVPAITELRENGLNAIGPLPADTAFHAEARRGYDAILCMYHDQALIPAKTLDFHGGVNVTLGLPFIRTSPDHGTALGIAGTGQARPDSLIAAIRLAKDMARATA